MQANLALRPFPMPTGRAPRFDVMTTASPAARAAARAAAGTCSRRATSSSSTRESGMSLGRSVESRRPIPSQ